MRISFVGVGLCLMVALAACDAKPTQEYTTGNVLLTEEFENVDAWENFTVDTANAEFSVQDGVYRARTEVGGFLWGLNQDEHDDVVIEALTKQNSAYEDNFFGVMCRADVSNNGDGYYFLISGDGYGAIAYGHEESVDTLADPVKSNAINRVGINNVVRAVCIGDYLALYVNGTFVTEARDSHYSSGYTGMAVSTNESDDSSVDDSVDISFDHVTISEAAVVSK